MAPATLFIGKTLEDAVKKGLDALGISRAEAMITVIEEGSGGFLGLGARPYRVRIMARPGGPIREPDEREGRRSRDREGRSERGGRRERGGRAERAERGERGTRGERSGRGPRYGRTREGEPAADERRAAPRGDEHRGAPRVDERRGTERGGERRDGGRPFERRGGDRRRGEGAPRLEERRGEPMREPREQPTRPAFERQDDDERRVPVGAQAALPGAEGAEEPRRRRRRGRRGGRGRGGAARAPSAPEMEASAAPAARAPLFDRELTDRDMPDREMGDREMSDREAPDREMTAADFVPAHVPEPAAAVPPFEPGPRAEFEAAEPSEPGLESRAHDSGAPERRPFRDARRRSESPSRAGSGGPALSSEALAAEGRRCTEELLTAMGYQGKVTATASEDRVDVVAEVGTDDELLNGPKGEVRQALQHLLNRMVNRGEGSRYHLQLEINDFWKRREEELQELARQLADRAVANQAEALTEYLNAQERRIIHVALREDTRVKTYALGDGMIKRLAVAPADFPEGPRAE